MPEYGDKLVYDKPAGVIGPFPDGMTVTFIDVDEDGWPLCEFEDSSIRAIDPELFANFNPK